MNDKENFENKVWSFLGLPIKTYQKYNKDNKYYLLIKFINIVTSPDTFDAVPVVNKALLAAAGRGINQLKFGETVNILLSKNPGCKQNIHMITFLWYEISGKLLKIRVMHTYQLSEL